MEFSNGLVIHTINSNYFSIEALALTTETNVP